MSAQDHPQIYHEKQIRELCALHALNNLFQEKNFSKMELDSICHNLSPDVWINPHKSVLGLGNYDINVIMKALQTRNCEAVWFDKRKDPCCLNLKNIWGFILNVPSEYKISFITLPLRRRHWITLKSINGIYYNLDSKLETPEVIGREQNILEYIKDELDCKDKELFLVVTNEVAKNQSWLLSKSSYCNNIPERDAEIVKVGDILTIDDNITFNPLSNKSKTISNLKVTDWENMVGVVINPIQTVKAFDELPNLYEVLHYVVGRLSFLIHLSN